MGRPASAGRPIGCVVRVLVLVSVYQTPREKKPSSASTRMTIRTIQRIPMSSVPLFRHTGNEAQRESDTGNETNRSIAGSTPKRSRSSRYSFSARSARDGEGARSARNMTFFAVCSAETNSITSTR